ncbi:uncharacterized protein LOC124353963 isoform X2 [Homalodisca vitripennis]|nr:uncharacterized protein LOC124353963 isoform X2 [Homalodisca vitripennis]KAG8287330.1 hypothetical protein J6590_041574 [Homalodisca vitripennis]
MRRVVTDMRVLAVCLAVSFAVLLALPESSGAPACGCGKKVGGEVISETIQKESSKSTEKRKQEEQEASVSQCRCKNGLVSGSKKICLSEQVSNKEEEQSRLAAEKKTTTGSEKIEESEKKKKEVTVDQKKSLVVYYLVSYKRLPSQRRNEARDAYYKRVFPKENNLHVFYHKIFKAYEGEKPNAYVERVEFIFQNVYPELDCRLDVKWLDTFDHYYTLKYSRKADESDESYFPRVLKKECGESTEHYKKRMECLMASLDEEDFTHITIDDSEQGYKIGQRKTPAKSRSSPASTGIRIGQLSETTKKSRSQEVEMEKDENSVEQSNKQGSSAAYQKRLKKKRRLVEKEENTKAYAYRVAYTALPKKCAGESDTDYYLRFFGKYDSNWNEAKRNELYLRILIQYKGESVANYVKRIDYLFDNVYPQLDIRTKKLAINLLDHYYREKYARLEKETEEKWFTRVLTKKSGESPTNYKARVSCLQAILTDVKWGRVVIEENSDAGFRLITAGNKSC